jgi:hypothetical protein
MKGYKATYNGKAFNDFLFEVGKTYEFDGKPVVCARGFHFCKRAQDVMNYYDFFSGNFVLFEINAIGDLDTSKDKSCTNKIEIVRVVPREEYKEVFENESFKFNDENCLGFWWKEPDGWEWKCNNTGYTIWQKFSTGHEYENVDNIWTLIKK